MPITSMSVEEDFRITMNLFFVVDVSASMVGERLEALNQAVREALPIIKEIPEENVDANIRIAVLKFSDSVKWIYDEPIDANDFEWIDLAGESLTNMGTAFAELNSKLSRNAFLSHHRISAPVIILSSDGSPTDDYKHYLDELRQNKWFQVAIKIAIAIGDGADKDVLSEFTGNKEAVFSADNVFMLKTIIITASVKSIGYNPSTSSVAEAIREALDSKNNSINKCDY